MAGPEAMVLVYIVQCACVLVILGASEGRSRRECDVWFWNRVCSMLLG